MTRRRIHFFDWLWNGWSFILKPEAHINTNNQISVHIYLAQKTVVSIMKNNRLSFKLGSHYDYAYTQLKVNTRQGAVIGNSGSNPDHPDYEI